MDEKVRANIIAALEAWHELTKGVIIPPKLTEPGWYDRESKAFDYAAKGIFILGGKP